jgi:hypothetical protein
MVTFNDFPEGVIKNVWYSNELGNKVWVYVEPKRDRMWYEIEMRPKGHAKAHTRKCYSFFYALEIANENEEESYLYP